MTIIKPLLPVILSVSLPGLCPGCATLPKVSDVIDEAPAREAPRILSAKGMLSPEKSKDLMERLKQSAAPSDMLQRYTAVIDGAWSTVGSTNMDFRSFSRNDEVNAVILDKEFAAEMERMFARDLADSDEIRLDKWKKRPLLPRIKELIAHLFAHWL